MVSGQLNCVNRLYAVRPDGKKLRLFSANNAVTGPGGSPDGVQATVKANELPEMAVNPQVLNPGTKIIPYVELRTSDGLDASDCVWSVPILRNGAPDYLNQDDLGINADLPAAFPVDREVPIGSGYTVEDGDNIQLGGGTYFISSENDA
jgi:hypothetical protein